MIVINFWPPCQGRQVSVCVVDGECVEFSLCLYTFLFFKMQLGRSSARSYSCWWKRNTRWLLDFNSPRILYPDSSNNSAAADTRTAQTVWL